jgi:hypothetical protein
MIAHGTNFYVFGGQDDDNNKLNDVWCYDGSKWECIKFEEGEACPIARSGHTAVVNGNKMYIFGGMVELTKELNDLAIFDLDTKKFIQADPCPFGEEVVAEQQEASPSPVKRGQTLAGNDMSPTMKRGMTFTATGSPSPNSKKRAAATTLMHNIMQPNHCTPPPRKKKIAITAQNEGMDEKHDGLSSPISIEMKQSFIISNADDSFDAYYQSMRKRGKLGMTTTDPGMSAKQTKFGMVSGKPAARDGHSANVDKRGCMYVFGGDRHQMPFNDLYMIKLM